MTGGLEEGQASALAAEGSPYLTSDKSWMSGLQGIHMTVRLDDSPAFEGVLCNVGDSLASRNISGARMVRRGGPHPADAGVQQVLMAVLGAAALASGHIEMEMKRILLVTADRPEVVFSDVDLSWKSLEDRLWKVATRTDETAERLKVVLHWGKERELRERRNTLMHSAWALYDVGHFEGARIVHKGEAETWTRDQEWLTSTAALLREYLNRLQTVVCWPTLVLPPLGAHVPVREVAVEVTPTPGAPTVPGSSQDT